MFLKAWDVSPMTAVLFAAGFSGCLVGAKICLAILAGRSRHLLGERTYRTFMRVLAVFLAVFALRLLRDGVLMLGVGNF
jgi:threonine/homoserine/homoserine lactone efflux protein